MRAVHGSTHVPANTPEAVRIAVHALMDRLIDPGDVVIAAIFTSTDDLDAAFPAAAAREWGIEGALLGLAAAGAARRRVEVLIQVVA